MADVDLCCNYGNNGKKIKDGEMKGTTNKGKCDKYYKN